MSLKRCVYVLVSLALFSGLMLFFMSCDESSPTGSTSESGSWQQVVDNYMNNVFMIGFIPEGEDYIVHVGTGWAIDDDKIMTNAHVAYGIYDWAREYFDSPVDKIVAVKNQTFAGAGGTYELLTCSPHPSYNNLNPFSNDFAVFTIDTSGMAADLVIADNSTLYNLALGQEVGTLGYPGELSGTDMDATQPIATFKDGTISALRPFDQQNTPSSSEDNTIMQYNFGTTGGTSGSPVFLKSGEAIAIHNSGISVVVPDMDENPVRIDIGNLNFGIRLDQRTNVVDMPHAVDVSDFRDADPSQWSVLQAGQYRITMNWNSEDFDLWTVVNESQFITGWVDASRAHIFPFCVHHGDETDGGPEVTTLTQLVEEVVIFGMNWSDWASFNSRSATCTIESSTGTIANVSPPTGSEGFWIVGTLSSDGIFTEINELTDEDPMESITAENKAFLNKIGTDKITKTTVLKVRPKKEK